MTTSLLTLTALAATPAAEGIQWPLLWFYIAVSVAGGLGMYWGIGGFFEYFWYVRRRNEPETWKCQPKRFALPKMRKHEFILGSANLTVASIASGVLVYYLVTGGQSSIYFNLSEHSLAFTIGTTLAYLLGVDYLLYWAHRIYHVPYLFRTVHRFHHRYTSPTAFTSMAMHPIEFATYQIITAAPMFFLPVWVGSVIMILIYTNIVALIDHSGIKIYSWNPLQPPSQFHDDHHVYFHVNYGQNLGIWDWAHGTWRRYGRKYGATVFGGKGTALAVEGAHEPDRFVDYSKGAQELATDAERKQSRFVEG